MSHRDNPRVFSLWGQSLLRVWITRNENSKIAQCYSFFVCHLSYPTVSLYVKDGISSHRCKSRASKEIRIYYNDIVISTSHFLHRYILLNFLVQWQKIFLNWATSERKKSVIAALSSTSLKAIIIFLSLWNKANPYHNYLLNPHW